MTAPKGMTREKALELVRKLMVRTEDRGATKDEAEDAAAKIQHLLMRHDIDMAEVEEDTETRLKIEVTKDEYESEYNKMPA